VEHKTEIGLSLGWVFWWWVYLPEEPTSLKNAPGVLGICPGVSTLNETEHVETI